MEPIWRKARHGRIVHAYPASSVLDLPLCGASVAGPFLNGYPAPPAEFERVRHCRRCLLALRRHL